MNERNGAILVLDDDTGVLKRLERLLRFNGYEDIILCEHASQVWKVLESRKVIVMILDLLMPDVDGYAVLDEMNSRRPEVPVIVATAVDDLDIVVRCMKAGAFDYVPKSAEATRLIASIRHAEEIGRLLDDNKALKDSLLGEQRPLPDYYSRVITGNRGMIAIFRYIDAIACSEKPILITGESGTGKELFAAAVHAASGRKGPLVTVNIAGLDDAMFSDTLFGHKKGSYTGAETDRSGLIEKAAGGTLFLDEIGDLSPQSQVKLLRLIEQKLYYPLGSDLTRPSDALIVAATHRNLQADADSGRFRLDLFYRLETHHIRIPPLRERPDDIPLLVEYFAEKAAGKFGKKKPSIPEELYDLLLTWDFPGNIRELESMIYDAIGRAEGRILPLESFKARIFKNGAYENSHSPARSSAGTTSFFSSRTVLPTLKELSDELIQEALKRAGGNQGIAAGFLGISRTALNRRLKNDDEE